MKLGTILSLALGFAVLFGCDRGPTDEMLEEARYDPEVRALNRVGKLYEGFHDSHTEGPASWEELVRFSEDDEGSLEAIQLVRDNGFDLKWRVKIREVGKKNARDFVLGKSRRSQAKLMLDGTIKF